MTAEAGIGSRGNIFDRWIVSLATQSWQAISRHRLVWLAGFAFVVLLCAFLALKAVGNQITETSVGREDRDSLERLIEGTAARPFAFRMLTPTIVGVIRDVLPVASLPAKLPGSVQGKLDQLCSNFTAVPTPSCDTVAVFIGVDWLWYFVFLLTMAVLARKLVRPGLLPVVGAIGLAYLMVNTIIMLQLSHAYDFGTLMFGALLVLCLAYEKDAWFCVVLAIAVLNKESAIIYGLAFLVANARRLRPTRLAVYLVIQAAALVILHGAVRYQARNNPGQGIEVYLRDQIFYFTEHIGMARFVGLVLAFVLMFYQFPRKNPTLRRATVVVIPWLVLFIIGGQPGELRVIYEVMPVLLLLATDSIVALVTGASPPGRLNAPATIT